VFTRSLHHSGGLVFGLWERMDQRSEEHGKVRGSAGSMSRQAGMQEWGGLMMRMEDGG